MVTGIPLLLRLGMGVVLLLTQGVAQENPWILSKEKNGIQVYTRSVPGSQYKAFKAVTDVACTLEGAIRELKDLESFSEWYFLLREGKKLLEKNPDEGYCYVIMDMPWPVADRDNIFYYRWDLHEVPQRAFLFSESRPQYQESKPPYIRIPQSISTWEMERLGPDSIRLTHEAHAEPGGSIPAWLANNFVTEGPYRSLWNLKKRLEGR